MNVSFFHYFNSFLIGIEISAINAVFVKGVACVMCGVISREKPLNEFERWQLKKQQQHPASSGFT